MDSLIVPVLHRKSEYKSGVPLRSFGVTDWKVQTKLHVHVNSTRRIEKQDRKDVNLFMTQVSAPSEHQAAIAAQETDIEVTADLKIDTMQRITYAAAISVM